jgi:hypothetical protein
MKSYRIISVCSAAFGLSASAAEPTRPPAPPSNVRISVMINPPAPYVTWSDIEGYSYDRRAAFFAGLAPLEERADEQVRELTAQRALLKSPGDIIGWDFAMKEMQAARSHLKAMGEELRRALPGTWEEKKGKVGLAWVRTETARDKVRFSPSG